MKPEKVLFLVYVATVVFFSLVAIVTYFIDKKKAEKGKPRIPEKILLLLATANGAIGSLIGRILAHHKTDKVYFSIVIYFALLIQVLVAGFLFYQGFVA